MAVHAAMVDRMDQGIGELIDALEKNNQLDNTLILFLSDNGCSSEVCQNYSEGENDRPDMTRIGEKIIYPRKKEVLPVSSFLMHLSGRYGLMLLIRRSVFGKRNLMRRNQYTFDSLLAQRYK